MTEERARPIREAASIIEKTLERQGCRDEFLAVFGSRWRGSDADDSISARAAWGMIGIWAVARLSGGVRPLASFDDAEAWFFGGAKDQLPSLASRMDRASWLKAFWLLESVTYDRDFADLLPYILDVHGPGSRQSVMKDASTAKARAAKRKAGVFYTPADVAEYMAEKTLKDLGQTEAPIRCYDPACGSGVFLRATSKVAMKNPFDNFDRFTFAAECLYGSDIDPAAVEAACFVLLHDCLQDAEKRGMSPWHAWHVLRLNLAVVDSLHVAPARAASFAELGRRFDLRNALLLGGVPPYRACSGMPDPSASEWFGTPKHETPVNELFPEIEQGFDIVIGNPPYAAIGKRGDSFTLESRYTSLRGKLSPKDDFYPLFLEKSWLLTKPRQNAAAFVVPLSIAYHRGTQYRACRRRMIQQGGRWQFAFFDREPHALFGEDVKTRNAIVFHRESKSDPARGARSTVETGPLQKWTSRSREQLFSTIQFTQLEDPDVSAGIPKLCGAVQSHAATTLLARSHSLSRLWSCARSCLPAEAFNHQEMPTVFVASTAYNFLNVFRPHRQVPEHQSPMSENPLLMLQFPCETSAAMALAILSSRLTFWLWHVQCDGFHVPRWFVESIPYCESSFTENQTSRLADWGSRLWDALQDFQIVSLNRGRETIAYRSLACELERDEIDRVLADAAGLGPDFTDELRRFVRATVVIDESDVRRETVQTHFQRMESIT